MVTWRKIPGKEIWRRKWKQRDSNTTGRRWRRQSKIELDGEEWSVAYALHGVTRLKQSKLS